MSVSRARDAQYERRHLVRAFQVKEHHLKSSDYWPSWARDARTVRGHTKTLNKLTLWTKDYPDWHESISLEVRNGEVQHATKGDYIVIESGTLHIMKSKTFNSLYKHYQNERLL